MHRVWTKVSSMSSTIIGRLCLSFGCSCFGSVKGEPGWMEEPSGLVDESIGCGVVWKYGRTFASEDWRCARVLVGQSADREWVSVDSILFRLILRIIILHTARSELASALELYTGHFFSLRSIHLTIWEK